MTPPDIEELNMLQEASHRPQSRFNLGTMVLLFGVVMMVIVVGIALLRQNETQPTEGPAPEFSLMTFDDAQFTLAEKRGTVVLLNFWGYWCAPCRDEAPLLQQVYEQYREQGVEFIGVTYLAPETEKTTAFIGEFGLSFPNGDDLRSAIAEDYHITGAPESFLIDRNGDIIHFFFGPIPSTEVLAGALDCALTLSGEEARACIRTIIPA